MEKRFVSIWFSHLVTDWFSLSEPDLHAKPLVIRKLSHGRMIITAANKSAELSGVFTGMVLADARVVIPSLEIKDDKPDLIGKLLHWLAEWCIRFTPIVAVDPPDGLIIDATGCSHLWGGDENYINEISTRLQKRGYSVRVSIADTIGCAWAVARFGKDQFHIKSGAAIDALLNLPAESLRLDDAINDRLHKLGLHKIRQFLSMPRAALRRRFGQSLITRLDMAIGQEIEMIQPVMISEPYHERLVCLDPIVTATGVEYALQNLLEAICLRLQQEQKGLREAVFKGFRVDGKVEAISISTASPSHHVKHLFKLFELKIVTMEPSLGFELFTIDALKIEDHFSKQEKIWEGSGGLEDERLTELIDRIAIKVGTKAIQRYLPAEHYWPERSFKPAVSLQEKKESVWRLDKTRPLELLKQPEPIEVTAPIPDYPPMLFIYKGVIHKISRADGPERIEQEWWLQQGQHRDYYQVEDEEGHRYWLFRLGHYDDEKYQWFLHGFFA